jgi:hypothetical protein
VSDESFKFTPGKTPKFPMLVMRAFSDADNFAEWILTPAEGAGWFEYRFEAKQENGSLFINFDRSMMQPKPPDVP